ncbi:hypothetical protein ACFQV4_25325 [Streptomyces thermocarboxydus]
MPSSLLKSINWRQKASLNSLAGGDREVAQPVSIAKRALQQTVQHGATIRVALGQDHPAARLQRPRQKQGQSARGHAGRTTAACESYHSHQ